MDYVELATRFNEAWNNRDASEALRLMHPQASYYDAFWQETCSDKHLAKFVRINIENDTRWYRDTGPVLPTPNGVVIRYVAFDMNDPAGLELLYNGATVFTMADDLIMTVSDYYCDPNPVDLIEIAQRAEGQHGRAAAVKRGLSAYSAGIIMRRLADIATDTEIIIDRDLTVTKLAEHADCSVMHLFHILEVIKDTSFLSFVDECRARYASTLITEKSQSHVRFDEVAEKAGFESIKAFNQAFVATFDLTADEYMQKFGVHEHK